MPAKTTTSLYDRDAIRTALERKRKALSLRPSIGQGTAVTTVRVREDFTCDVEDGAWRLTADLSEKSGGQAAGPDPGVLGRAALGSCLAICYVRWAAWLDVPITRLDVEVQADYDARGEYAVADIPPGYTEVRYRVTVASEASEAEIRHLLETAEARTPWLDVYRRPQRLHRELHLISPDPS